MNCTRRGFLRTVGLGCAAGVLPRSSWGLSDVEAKYGPGAKVLLRTGFEDGDPCPELTGHEVVSGGARTGKRCLTGAVDEPKRALKLEIPFTARPGRRLFLSFHARGEGGCVCAVFCRHGGRRQRIAGADALPKRWKAFAAELPVDFSGPAVLEIVAPSSFNNRPGRAWIDDVLLVETADARTWPDCVQDFPALARDGQGAFWLASIERRGRVSAVRLDRGLPEARTQAAVWSPPGATAVAEPAVVGLPGGGAAVAMAVEADDRWRIGVARVGRDGEAAELAWLDAGGTSNIAPALAAAGETLWVLWESNAGEARGVYAARVGPEGKAGEPRRLTDAASNSYNPAVVARPDGSLVGAWDSLRDGSADIYAAECRDGQWGVERRLTCDPRIERRPHLALRGGEVWMAWQAQAYPRNRVNAVGDQRIAVARLGEGFKLTAPAGVNEAVNKGRTFLVRPHLAADTVGGLWLTARASIAPQGGWRAVCWRIDGAGRPRRRTLSVAQGRRRPVTTAFGPDGGLACCQYDDLPKTWSQRGEFRDWRSGLRVVPLDVHGGPVAEIPTGELTLPPTDFSLPAAIEAVAADLPRQRIRRGGKELTLLFGDLHDHTDLSVCQRRANPPGHDLLANVRDIERLDFCAITDHGYNFDPPQWAYHGAEVRANHDAGRFVTFLGEEWTSSKNPPPGGGRPTPEAPRRYGHHNLVFLDPHHERFYDAFDGDISPADLWKELDGVEFLCIPHQLADWRGRGGGNPPTDWSFTDERLQPVAEIFQARQSYEYLGCPRQSPSGAPFKRYYLQDAWAQGVVIGVIASPDHGGGMGKAGVWAERLDRRAIFDAIRRRHTFGTSGAKMALLLTAGEGMMGDKLPRPSGQLSFHVRALAARPIRELVLFRNNRPIHRLEPNAREVETDLADPTPPPGRLWYYARIHTDADELAWTSPMWYT